MNTQFRKLTLGLSVTLAAAATLWAIAPRTASVNGQGTLIVTNDSQGNAVRRHFSVNAQLRPDGTVTGNAVLHNPAFPGEDGNAYYSQIDISCMHVVGNTAIMGGYTRKTNDPNLINAVYFSVQDNGEPGKNKDMISGAVFFDNTPNQGDPALCMLIGPDDLGMTPIEAGNLQVRSNIP